MYLANRQRTTNTSATAVSIRTTVVKEKDVVYKESELSVVLKPVAGGFAAPVKINNQTFDLLVDTGSSDTWLVDSFFFCLSDLTPDHEKEAYNQSKCLFGPTYDRGHNNPFRTITGSSFKVYYASGDEAGGPLGYAQMGLANNLEIPAQQIGLASAAVWHGGDRVVSGILGLGLPGLTHRYKGTNLWQDILCVPGFVYPCNQEYYESVVWSLFKNFTTDDDVKNKALLSEQVFSLTLVRNSSASDGLLTLGGVPDLSLPVVNTTTPFTRVSLEIKKYDNDYRHYVILTSSFTYGTENGHTTTSADGLETMIDAGSMWNFLPAKISKGINLSFSPPAFRYASENTSLRMENPWAIDCNDYTAPEVGVEIGGEMFWHNKKDLVRRFQVIEYTDNDKKGNGVKKEICLSTIQDGVKSPDGTPNSNFMLGQPFLQNVLAAFDIGRMEMGFAARTEYT